MRPPRSFIPLLAICFAFAAAGCGSDSPSSAGSATTPSSVPKARAPATARAGAQKASRSAGGSTPGQHEPARSPAGPEPAFQPRTHHDSGGGSQQFEAKGGDSSIQEYGNEPSRSEFEEAAAVLHEYLDARAAGAWRVACQKLAPAAATELVRQLGPATGEAKAGCAQILAGLTAGLPPSALREAAVADVGALRAEGNRGFLLFRGARGQNYFFPMVREWGHWRAAAIAASPLL